MTHRTDRIEYGLRRLLNRFGKYLVYVRTNHRYYCDCWNEDSKEGNPRHATCLGTGYKIQVETLLGHVQMASPQGQLNSALATARIGEVINLGLGIFFLREAWPQLGDIIAEVEWDVDRDFVPTRGHIERLITLYSIEAIEHLSGLNSSVVGHRCAVTVTQSQSEWMDEALKSTNFYHPPVAGQTPIVTSPSTSQGG